MLHGGGGLKGEEFKTGLDAVLKRRTVRIRYRGRTTREATDGDVDPYGLVIRDGQWYLVGFCHLRREVRAFKGIRIERLEISPLSRGRGPDFAIPKGLDIRSQVDLPRWRQGKDGPPFRAEVWFDKEIWWWVKENWRWLGRDQKDLGGGVLSVEVHDADAFLGAVLELGVHAEIKGPPFLRRKMVETLKELVQAHG